MSNDRNTPGVQWWILFRYASTERLRMPARYYFTVYLISISKTFKIIFTLAEPHKQIPGTPLIGLINDSVHFGVADELKVLLCLTNWIKNHYLMKQLSFCRTAKRPWPTGTRTRRLRTWTRATNVEPILPLSRPIAKDRTPHQQTSTPTRRGNEIFLMQSIEPWICTS